MTRKGSVVRGARALCAKRALSMAVRSARRRAGDRPLSAAAISSAPTANGEAGLRVATSGEREAGADAGADAVADRAADRAADAGADAGADAAADRAAEMDEAARAGA